MVLHENCLPADNSHEISCFICLFVFEKGAKFETVVCCIIGGALYYHLEETESVPVFVFSSSMFLSTSLFAINEK